MAKLYPKRGIFYAWGYLPSGERWIESTRTRSKREAERVAVDLERDVRLRADRAAREGGSLGWALRALVDSLKAGGKAAGTIVNTDIKARHLIRVLGAELPLTSLEPPQGRSVIAEYVKARVGDAARSTIAVEVNVLRMALRVAAREGRYHGDTRQLSVTELRGAHRPRKRWLTKAEARKAIALTPPQWRNHVIAYLGLGVRREELYQLAEVADGRVHVKGTKTHGADRWVPVPKHVAPLLRGAPPYFRPWTRISADLAKVAKDAGIEHFTVSDLRRTYTSWLLSEGVSLGVLKELLGHTSTRQIELVYGHASEASLRDAVSRLPAVRGAKASRKRGAGKGS